jgi:fatty-acyl-CoA synthase
MIIRGGENIYPIEIEEFFIKHNSISDIQIIGIDDELMGQEVCAWITLKEGCSLSVDELREYALG